MFNLTRTFELLKKISYTRIGGSKEEKEVANIIQEEIEKLGIEAKQETFEVDWSDVELATLEVTEPFKKEILCEAVRMSSSTPDEGIEGELVYVENCEVVNLLNVENKIVLLEGRIFHKIYKKLIDANVAGFIAVTGSIYDTKENSDLLINQIRKKDYELGYIPGVTIRAKDAQELASYKNLKVRIKVKQNQTKKISQNVICEIKGSKYPNEVIAFTAHYDSVRFSSGAYDNASGSVGIMELLHYYNEHKPERTLKFIWCGSEEMGLLGSRAYCAAHKDELESYRLNINIDMIGVILGHEIAVVTGEMALVNYLSYLAKEIGIACNVSQGVYSSDSTPFAEYGVPSISFARISPASGARIHDRNDIIETMSPDSFYSSLYLIESFATRVIKSVCFPITKNIPQNMKDEIDYYNLVKERPSKN